MSSLKPPPSLFADTETWLGSATRNVLAWWLEGASAALARLATRLVSRPAAASAAEAHFEFHALGDGDGALYVNGELVSRLQGVRRL